MFGKKIRAPQTHPVSAVVKSDKKVGGWSSLRRKKTKKDKWSFTGKSEGDIATYYTESPETAHTSSALPTDVWRTTALRPLPVIGKLDVKKQYAIAMFLAIFGIVSSIFTYTYIQNKQSLAVEERLIAGSVGGLSEAMAKNLQRYASGKEDAKNGLLESKKNISESLSRLGKFDGGNNTVLDGVKKEWAGTAEKIDDLIEFAPAINQSSKTYKEMKNANEEVANLLQKFAAQTLRKESDESSRIRILDGFSYMQKLDASAASLIASETYNPENSFALTKQTLQFKKYIQDMEFGDEINGINKVADASARENLLKIKDIFNASMVPFSKSLSVSAGSLQFNKKAANEMAMTSNLLPKKINELIESYDKERKSLDNYFVLVGILAVIFALGVVLAITIYVKDERRMEIESRATLARNQQAVTQLLNELDPVREGDLTKKVTVSDEYTSTIGDAINATVEGFNGLVKNMKQEADNMYVSAEEMGSFSNAALLMSEKQVESVSEAAESINSVEANLQDLAKRTSETASIAEKSLEVTRGGSSSVRESIAGMEVMKNKLQDTRNRVGKLKDTSGQIAEILYAIKEIAEKTKVLAINANLEAKRAGEAGKGFNVVAKSVEDLAKQASEATNKIGALVDSVQSDIEGAVKSMSETENDMKNASSLSETTGDAFAQIEMVSEKLSETIRGMRDSVLDQASESVKIQEKMNEVVTVVKDVNKMNQTANAAAKKVEKSVLDLKQSTQRFVVA